MAVEESTADRVDWVAGSGYADLRVDARTFTRVLGFQNAAFQQPYTCCFLFFFSAFLFFFFISLFLSVSRERSSGFSLKIQWPEWERRRAPPYSERISDDRWGRSKASALLFSFVHLALHKSSSKRVDLGFRVWVFSSLFRSRFVLVCFGGILFVSLVLWASFWSFCLCFWIFYVSIEVSLLFQFSKGFL